MFLNIKTKYLQNPDNEIEIENVKEDIKVIKYIHIIIIVLSSVKRRRCEYENRFPRKRRINPRFIKFNINQGFLE